METLQHIQLLRTDNSYVSASMVRLTHEVARAEIDSVWWKDASLLSASIREGDAHWKWESIVIQYSRSVLRDSVAVLSQEGYLEGAMAYQFDARSSIDVGAGSVYIGWLATAPRNRAWLVSQPLYKGIGSVLTYQAVRESYLAGLGGRVSLQSLPTPGTVLFYEKKGFVRTDRAQPTAGLIDYELPQSAALGWLRKEGDLDD